MADISFGFEDTDDCEFIDWDCVWRDWSRGAFKTISTILALKYRDHPMAFTKYVVRAIGKKTSVVEKL